MPDITFLLLDSRDLGGDSTFFDTNIYTPVANTTILIVSSGVGSVPPPEPIIPVVSGNSLTWSHVASQRFDWAGTNRGIVNVHRGIGSAPTNGATRVQYNRTFFRQALSLWQVNNSDIGNLGADAIVAIASLKLAPAGGLNPAVTMPAASDPANATLGILAWRDEPATVNINPQAGNGFSLLVNRFNVEGGGHAVEFRPSVLTNVDWIINQDDPDLALIGVELRNAQPALPAGAAQVQGRPAFISGNLIS